MHQCLVGAGLSRRIGGTQDAGAVVASDQFDRSDRSISRIGGERQLTELVVCSCVKRVHFPLNAVSCGFDVPLDGVQQPLSSRLKEFHLIAFEKCGHKPWIERHARARFYQVLRTELHAS